MLRLVDKSSSEDVEELICPYCGSKSLVYSEERGELTCQRCGSVISERIVDYGPEWRAYTPEDKERRERVKPINIAAPGMSIGTEISEVKGSGIAVLKFKILKELHKSTKVSSSIEKNVMIIQDILRPLKLRLNLPDTVIEDSIILYRSLIRKGFKASRLKELAIALLYLACRRNKVSCRLKELIKESNVNRRRFTKILNKIKTIIALSSTTISDEEIAKYVLKVLNRLSIDDSSKIVITKIVLDIIRSSKYVHLTNGRSIHSLAASAIYIATTLLNVKKKQKEVADAAGVTDVTIRSRYREILNKINIEVEV